MVQGYSPEYPKIGGCTTDKTVFYVGSEEAICPFCANPPDYTTPFTGAGSVATSAVIPPDEAAAEPAEIIDIPSQCPDCGAQVRVVITNSDVQIVPAAPIPPAEPSAEEDAPLPSVEGSPSEIDSPGVAPESEATPLIPTDGPGESIPVASETP